MFPRFHSPRKSTEETRTWKRIPRSEWAERPTKRELKVLWDQIVERDGTPICPRCGDRGTSIDHIRPICRGGTNDLENLRIMCWQCNREKKDMPVI